LITDLATTNQSIQLECDQASRDIGPKKSPFSPNHCRKTPIARGRLAATSHAVEGLAEVGPSAVTDTEILKGADHYNYMSVREKGQNVFTKLNREHANCMLTDPPFGPAALLKRIGAQFAQRT
jgi:hypothetical protein